ncbi:MAG: cadherin-like beta sandwich domain-containing protein [Fibrobacteria bacterium]|nr:cadherin-like beta sandwich domain-containing protein [Fibrobacteria bacterium]
MRKFNFYRIIIFVCLATVLSLSVFNCKLSELFGEEKEERNYIEIDDSQLDPQKYDSLTFIGINENSDDTILIYTWYTGDDVPEKLFYPDELKGNFTVITIGMKDGKIVGAQSTTIDIDNPNDIIDPIDIEELLNKPPNAPSAPIPAHEFGNRDTVITLIWSCSDPDSGNELSYVVFLGKSKTPEDTLEKTTDTTTKVDGLQFETDYYWQIAALDGTDTTLSQVWKFTTKIKPLLHISSPDSTEQLLSGSIDTIKWETTGNIENIKIEYSADSTNTWKVIESTFKNDSGYYVWTVPDTSSSNAQIRISDLSTDVFDESEVFSIIPIPNTITVTYPNDSNVVWESGQSNTITWNSTGDISFVKIDYNLGDENWMMISKQTQNDGSYEWNIPDSVLSKKVTLRVSSLNGEVSDTNDNIFEITSPLVEKALVLLTPNGGETLQVESFVNITWTSSGEIPKIKLQYTNGVDWFTISDSTDNDSSYRWTVPDIESQSVKIKISDLSDSITDESDATISITHAETPKTITLTVPDGREEWKVGKTYTLRWENTGEINNVQLEYNTGTGWNVITDSTENLFFYKWTVPNVIADSVLVRVMDHSGNATDQSNESFTIVGSDNTHLEALQISAGELSPKFDSSVTSYSVSVPNTVAKFSVTPTTFDSNATITIDGKTIKNGIESDSVNLSVDINPILIKVTAQDGKVIRTYEINVTRLRSGNAKLTEITHSIGNLSPVFNKDSMNYTISVPFSIHSITVGASSVHPSAVIGYTSTGNISNEHIADLEVGTTLITITVTSEDANTILEYTIKITRAPSGNADLVGIGLSSGTLSPQFNQDSITYTVDIANNISKLTLMPTLADSNAVVRVAGAPINLQSGVVINNITVGGVHSLTMEITAQDGTTKNYTVSANRAPSADADLANIGLTPSISLTPVFHKDSNIYLVSYPFSITTTHITAEPAETNATVFIDSIEQQAADISLSVGVTAVTVMVTAQDGTTHKFYNLEITRQPNTDASVSALAFSVGNLDPAFTPDVYNYTLEITNDTTSVTLNATLNDSNATMDLGGVTLLSGATSSPVDLNVGAQDVILNTLAQDDTTTLRYTITINRLPSENANLAGLTLSPGTLSPGFGASTINYTANISYSATSVDITATFADTTATIEINGNTASSGVAFTVSNLSLWNNVIPVTVTAQKTAIKKTYTVTVFRDLWTDTYPNSETITGYTARTIVRLDGPGKIYMVALVAGSNTPTSTQVMKGQDDQGNSQYPSTDTLEIEAGVTSALQVEGLAITTSYDLYLVAEDENLNLQPTPIIRTVTTNSKNPPTIPVLTAPAHNATKQELSLLLSWQGGDLDGDDVIYTVYLDTVNPPENIVASPLTAETHQANNLFAGKDYYWKIQAFDGSASMESVTNKFSTNNSPHTPSTIYPSDGALGVDTAAVLQWNGGDIDGDAVTYEVFLSSYTPPDQMIKSTTATTHTTSGLILGTTYYWYVKADDGISTAVSSPVWTFTCMGTFTDSRDNHVYTYTEIGTQTWMAENLAYLPKVDVESSGSNDWEDSSFYYVYNYTPTGADEAEEITNAKATVNYQNRGVLYNWPAALNGESHSSSSPSGVQGVCPDGWHLPSDAEYKTLEMYLGMTQTVADGTGDRGTTEGKMLKATSWSGTDNYGFSALPSGYRDWGGGFQNLSSSFGLWTATGNASSDPYMRMLTSGNTIFRSIYSNSYGYSIRCVKN